MRETDSEMPWLASGVELYLLVGECVGGGEVQRRGDEKRPRRKRGCGVCVCVCIYIHRILFIFLVNTEETGQV